MNHRRKQETRPLLLPHQPLHPKIIKCIRPTMRLVCCFTIVETIILLSSLSSLIQGSCRRCTTASAFLQRNYNYNYTPAFSSKQHHRASRNTCSSSIIGSTSKNSKLFSSKVVAMVDAPPLPRREEDRGKSRYIN
jgi:hypothetical protein